MSEREKEIESKATEIQVEFSKSYGGLEFSPLIKPELIEMAEWADSHPKHMTNTAWPYEKELHKTIEQLQAKLDYALGILELARCNFHNLATEEIHNRDVASQCEEVISKALKEIKGRK